MKKAVITLMMLTASATAFAKGGAHLDQQKWIVTCSNSLQSKKKVLPLS